MGLAMLRNSDRGFYFSISPSLASLNLALENVMMPSLIAGESHTKAREHKNEVNHWLLDP